MRIIHYDMTLIGGYTISNNSDLYADRQENYTPEHIQRPGIRMTIEHCDDLDKLYAAFKYSRVDGVRPKFERQLPRILRGNEPSWKLDSVWFSGGSLYLSFINEALYKKYLAKSEALNRRGHRVDCYDFFAESAVLDSYESIWRNITTDLRFEVNNPNVGSTTVTLLSFGPQRTTCITEFDGNKKRCWDFQRSLSIREDSYKVTEWMQ